MIFCLHRIKWHYKLPQEKSLRKKWRCSAGTTIPLSFANSMRHVFFEHEACRIGCHCEADALRAGNDRRVDAGDLALRRDGRTTRISRIERRIGLNHIFNQTAVFGPQGAPERRYDACRDARAKAKRIADRNRDFPPPQFFELPDSAAGSVVFSPIRKREGKVLPRMIVLLHAPYMGPAAWDFEVTRKKRGDSCWQLGKGS